MPEGHWVGARREQGEAELSGLAYLSVTCDDCGRQNWWARSHLDEAERGGLGTVSALGRKLRCTYCAERGGSGQNLSLRAVPQEEQDHVGE